MDKRVARLIAGMCLLLLLSACVIGCGIGKPLSEALNTVTFAEQGGKTTLMLQAHVVKSTVEAARYLEGMEVGWTQSLERLAENGSHTC